jgi:2-polyprenyl-3-methyl-5-hydroxy-6-metoxy-1,4-benzoquinol methylase
MKTLPVEEPTGVMTIDIAVRELAHLSVYEHDGAGRGESLYVPGDAGSDRHFRFDRARFEEFFRLLPKQGKVRVLDLGANPYILTYAMARAGLEVVASGPPSPVPTSGSEFVSFERGQGERVLSVPLHRFNVESDAFPFEDESFDLVVCGELIEHLAHGPEHLLFECNRVLRNQGRLLLSTPNAVSLARLMSIARGVNPDWPFSPQGIYARHNRLYSPAELEDLLAGNGFQSLVIRGLTFMHDRSWYRPGLKGSAKWTAMNALHRILAAQPYRLRRLSEGLLLAAVKVSTPRLYRPEWLFGGADGVPMFAGGQTHV